MNYQHNVFREAVGCLPASEFFQLAQAALLGPGVHRIPVDRLAVRGPTYGHAALLTVFAQLLDAKRIVELGTGTGCGTRAFIEACRHTGGHVWSVDHLERPGKADLEGQHPEVTFVIDTTVGFASKWTGPVDLVYVDADHAASSVEADLTTWAPHSPRLFLVDDTLDTNAQFGSPLDGVEAFCRRHGWAWWNIPIATGLAILLKR